MREVTNPDLLRQLKGGSKEVTDPSVISQLEGERVPSLSTAPPETVWDKVQNFFADPKQDSARAVQALVDAEAINKANPTGAQITPSVAYRYRDQIDAGIKINPRAALLQSTIGDRVKQSWDIGVKQNQQGELGYKYVMSGDPKYFEAMQKLEPPGEEETFISEGLLEDSFRSAGKLLPMMLDVGMEGGTKGLGVGMGFGLAAGILGGPAAIPPAVVLGFKFGGGLGAFEASLRKESGLAVAEILRFSDAEGKKIDPNIARAAAFGVGAINAGIEVAQIGTLLKTIPGLNQIFSKAVIETVTSATVKEKLLALVGAYSSTVVKETGQEMAQESTNIVFEELAKKLNNNLKGTDIEPTEAGKVLERLKQTALESAKGFAVIAAPGTVASTVQALAPAKKITERPPAADLKRLQEAVAKQGGTVLGVEGETAIITDETGKITAAPVEEAEAALSDITPINDETLDTAVDTLLSGEITDEGMDAFIASLEPPAPLTVTDAATVGVAGEAKSGGSLNEVAALLDAGKPDEALAPLTEIGKEVFDEGATDYQTFKARMQERLGDLWERVKGQMIAVWETVKRFNESLGERGSITGDIKEALGEEPVRDKTDNEKLLRETRRKLANSAKTAKGVKARIRRVTGQFTVSNLVREDVAFRETLKKSAQAAQVAFRAGNAEGVATEKARMKEMLTEARKRDKAKAETQKIIDDINAVRKRLESLQPEIKEKLKPLFDSIDFTNMSEKSRVALEPLRDAYGENFPDQVKKAMDKLDKIPVRDFTVADLQDLRDLVQGYEKQNQEKEKERAQAIKDIEKIARGGGNIAVDYQKQIINLLSGLDFKKPTEAKLTELRSLKAFLDENGTPLGINQKYLSELARLSKTPVKDMTTDDLVKLRDTLQHLRDLGKLKANLKWKYNEKLRVRDLGKLIQSTRNIDPDVTNLKEKTRQEVLKVAAKSAYVQTLHTTRVADMADGYRNYEGENAKLIKELGQAETAATFEAVQKKIAFLSDLKAAGIETITPEMEIRMMVVMRIRENARAQASTLMKEYKLADIPVLTPQEETIVGLIRTYVNAQKNELAAAWEEINGEIFPEIETYYLPLKYEKEEHLIPDNNVQGGFRTTNTFDGFSNARKQGVGKLPRVDIINIFSEALDEQLWYLRMQPAIEDVRQLVLDPEYGEAAGEMLQSWWRDHLDILARRGWSNSAKNSAIAAGMRTVRHNLNNAVLLFKLSTIMMQPFAVFDAMAFVNSKFGPAAAARVLGETMKTVFVPGYAKDYIESSPELQMRQGGELALEEELKAATTDTVKDKAVRLGYSFIRKADVNTAAGVQKAVEKILQEEGAANPRVEAEFIMNLTNGAASVNQRPHILSTGEGARTWFTFQTFVLNRWGIIMHDLILSGIVHSDGAKQKILALTSLGILMMAGNAEDEARKKVAELMSGRKFKDRDYGAFFEGLLNLAATVPGIGPMINAATMGSSASVPAIRVSEDLAKAMVRIYAGKDAKSKGKGVMKAGEAGLTLYLGLPGTASFFDLLEGVMFNEKGGKK